MKGKIRYTLWAVVALAVFSSCAPKADDIRLEEVRGVEVLGSTLSQTRLEVRLAMANDSRTKITLREADLRLHSADSEIVELTLDQPVVLPRRSAVEVTLPLTLRFRGGLGALTAASRLSRPETVQVSGVVWLRAGMMSKKYPIEAMPLTDFMALIGVESWNF
jgi:LEA14-like dessication related protein